MQFNDFYYWIQNELLYFPNYSFREKIKNNYDNFVGNNKLIVLKYYFYCKFNQINYVINQIFF